MQMETVDCGAAALGIILAYHHCHIPLTTLAKQCHVSRDGVNVAHIIKAAQHFGMKAQTSREGLSQDITLPAILFWNRKHYVVLEGIKKDTLYINDPKQGHQKLSWQQFNTLFSGVIIQLTPSTDFKKIKKSTSPAKTLGTLAQGQWRALSALSLLTMCCALFNLSPLIITKLFIDKHNSSASSHNLFILMSVLLILQLSLASGSRILFRHLETRFASTLSLKLVQQLLKLPLTFFAHRRAGDLLYQMQTAERLSGAPWAAACSMLGGVIQGIMSLSLLCYYSPSITCIILCILFMHLLLNHYAQNKWTHVAQTVKARMMALSVATAQGISTMAQIKASCSEHHYLKHWHNALTQYLNAHHQSAHQQQFTQTCSFMINSLGYITLLILGFYCVAQHTMSIGDVMACQILFLSCTETLTQQGKLRLIQKNIAADLQYVDHIMDYPVPPRSNTSTSPATRQGRIQICDVSFGYSREFEPILHHINLDIAAGSHSAIIGSSGSGKSTLMYLLSGLYQPWSGNILIDGTPIEHIAPNERASLIGMVNQHHFFFQGSIRENLCLWHHAYSDAELMNVLRMACLDELIDNNEQVLSYQLTEGATNLSGGQRQRLELARTLLAKTPILLLDEASSALDPLIEQRIKKNLKRHRATQIVIAHRIDSIQEADIVYVLHQGQLLNLGAPQQLMAENPQAFEAILTGALP